MSRETERLIEVAALIGQRLGSAVQDVVPPEAHQHLINAQRELLTALFLIYEHQAGARRPRSSSSAARADATGKSPRRRVQRIDVD